MLWKNLTLPQAIICLGLIAATITAYKLFGEMPGAITLVLSSIINLLLGRGPVDSVQE